MSKLLARPDLAARRLEGRVRARRYATTTAMQAIAPSTKLRATGQPESEPRGVLLFGEVFDVLETVGDWAWGQSRRDGAVGWAPLAALTAPVLLPTHVVTADQAEALSAPDGAPDAAYGFNALLTADAREGDWIRIARAGWMHAADLGPVDQARQPEFAAD